MVTSVASSRDSDFTPVGSLTSDRCSEWLISSAPTSASMDCGILSTEHSSSSVWVTILTVLPRLTPGEVSVHHTQRHADADGRTFAEPHEIDMDREVAHRIEVEVARNDAVLLCPRDRCRKSWSGTGQDALAHPRSSTEMVTGAGCCHRSLRELSRRQAPVWRPPLPLFGRAVAFNSLTVAIVVSPCFLKS